MSSETKRGITRWLISEIAGIVFVAVTLFTPGRWDWGMGWTLVGVYTI